MTSHPAPFPTTVVPALLRARWRRAVAGVLMGGSLAVTTALGLATDAASATADTSGASTAASSSGSTGGSGTSDPSAPSGPASSSRIALRPGSTTVTHAVSQGS